MRIQALALAEGELVTQVTVNRTKRRITRTKDRAANLITKSQYGKIWKAAKKGETSKLITECTEIIQTLEAHLSEKARYDRAKQMRINLKRRVESFNNKDKTMLKLVINSIMQKY